MKKSLKGEIPRQAVYRLSVYMRCLMRPVSYTHLTLPTNREV